MSIERIEIEGYRSIRKIAGGLELGPVNVLLGANGAGKSNLIGFFAFLNQLVNKNLLFYTREQGGASRILRNGPKTTDTLHFKIDAEQNAYEATLRWVKDDSFFFDYERTFYHRPGYDRPYEDMLGKGHLESCLREHEGKRDVSSHVLRKLLSLRLYHFHDTSPKAQVKLPQREGDSETLASDAANLAPVLLKLQRKNPDLYEVLRQTVRLVAPFFDDFVLESGGYGPDGMILLQWKELGSEVVFGPDQLSDGTLRFMCLSALFLLSERQRTLILDEPELGLHPFAIQILADLVHAYATEGGQVLLSTQSTTLVNHFQPEQIIVVDRDPADGSSIYTRKNSPEFADWMDSYSLSELWEKNLLGGRP